VLVFQKEKKKKFIREIKHERHVHVVVQHKKWFAQVVHQIAHVVTRAAPQVVHVAPRAAPQVARRR